MHDRVAISRSAEYRLKFKIKCFGFTCSADCSASPILNFPCSDRIKNLASESWHAINIAWILSSFLESTYNIKIIINFSIKMSLNIYNNKLLNAFITA